MTGLAALALWLMRQYRLTLESSRYRRFVIENVDGSWVVWSALDPGTALAICDSRKAAELYIDDMYAELPAPLRLAYEQPLTENKRPDRMRQHPAGPQPTAEGERVSQPHYPLAGGHPTTKKGK